MYSTIRTYDKKYMDPDARPLRSTVQYSPTWVENVSACVAQLKERKANTLAIHGITSPKKEVPMVS